MSIKDRFKNNEVAFALWAGIAAFLAYFCMYMFRKPYTAGVYEGIQLFQVDYKIIIVIAQVLGYATSKFLGIKIISELKNENRVRLFLTLIGISWLALVGFAYSSPQWGVFWMFVNGLPLGLIWGIVFTYCEGRKFTEVITVILAGNFIITSGIAKSIGRWLISTGVAEKTMPMLAGLGVFPLLFLSLWMLSRIPTPTAEELQSKKERKPMTADDRRLFLKEHWVAIVAFVFIYLLLTIIRDIRDNFAVEIWSGLGFSSSPAIFTTAELPVTVIVLISLGILYRIADNHKALMTNLGICIAGITLFITMTFLFKSGLISPLMWMILTGIGLFLPYILMNGIIFDRFIAAFSIVGNVGFIMYISDAIGYMGSIGIMLYKNFGYTQLEWLEFYTKLLIYGGSGCLITLIILYQKFIRKT